MRYMLDTCTFLYLANDHDLLTKEVADFLRDITTKIPLISSDSRFPFYVKQGLKLIVNER